MKQKISLIGMGILFGLTIVFHLLVVAKIIPFDIVWGGRIQSESEMLKLELVSIALNLFFLFVVFAKAEIIKVRISAKFFRGMFWLMTALFLLNTLGNLMSENHLEKIIFTPITLILTVFSLILASSKRQEQ